MLDLLADAPRPGRGAPCITPIVFSTDDMAPHRRVDVWRGNYESFNSITLRDNGTKEFSARNEIWPLGDLAVMRNTAPAMAFERTARHIRRDGIDHWVIRVARSGHARFRFGDHCFAAGPMQPFLLSLGDASVSDRTAADWVSLYLPRDAFPDLSAGLEALGPGVLGGPGALLLAETLLLLTRRLPEMSPAQAPLLAETMRGLVTACLLGDVAPGTVAPRAAAMAQRERIRRVIRDNIASPTLGPDKISRLAGISRSQLYRLFEPHGGVARYVQAQRLRLARLALAEVGPGTSIATMAERLGFFDASAFSRAFRREFGATPSEVRAGSWRASPRQACATPGTAPADFGGLLRRLGASAARAAA